jgi:hypothetical protein
VQDSDGYENGFFCFVLQAFAKLINGSNMPHFKGKKNNLLMGGAIDLRG